MSGKQTSQDALVIAQAYDDEDGPMRDGVYRHGSIVSISGVSSPPDYGSVEALASVARDFAVVCAERRPQESAGACADALQLSCRLLDLRRVMETGVSHGGGCLNESPGEKLQAVRDILRRLDAFLSNVKDRRMFAV